ncbi:reverse transcriptase-like protein [Candidatus Woesearchaeota archaeon]|nr:reverse transcriptase-like protein [Candidatus Woesearchaeota archaeon]
MKLILYTDGGARGNPGPAAIGIVLMDPGKGVLEEVGEYIGETTNNVAEYRALLKGLELALQHECTELDVYSDSQLLVRQLLGEYKVKAAHLKPLFAEIQKKAEQFTSIAFTHVLRDHPGVSHADRLVNDALDEH